jgi:peptide chain release factor 2
LTNHIALPCAQGVVAGLLAGPGVFLYICTHLLHFVTLSSMQKEEIQKKITDIETNMGLPDFWQNKEKAQAAIKELQTLKDALEGVGKYDRGNAIMTIFSGAGGDDAEDFTGILLKMYLKFLEAKKLSVSMLHKNENDHGGYRNVVIEIAGKNAYGLLKNESGVHRLVRISPFNAKQLRHTSFSMVEVIPEFEETHELDIPESELRFEFARSSGPGGQNVNKRETAVRVVHIPTNLAVHAESERSQAQNKERALQILKGKLFKRLDDERKSKEKGMYVSKSTENEWGSQIRSYVFHPYQMIKDHRTNLEIRDIDRVLDGDLEEFIEAEKNI